MTDIVWRIGIIVVANLVIQFAIFRKALDAWRIVALTLVISAVLTLGILHPWS